MAARLAAPIIFSTTTRLLVDLNRSLDAADLFSEFTRDLGEQERDRILAEHYRPYRDRVFATLDGLIGMGERVLHIGVHSCTDVLDGQARKLDVALLFDPARASEASFCDQWRDALRQASPELQCPFNEPYEGTDDGLTTALRKRHAGSKYAGIEVEVRQGLVTVAQEQRAMGDLLSTTLGTLLNTGHSGGVVAGKAETR
jgi:predicted N-formylglutamate amidohydrolase